MPNQVRPFKKQSDQVKTFSTHLLFFLQIKTVNDQLNFIYQQLLVKQQLIVKAQKDSNVSIFFPYYYYKLQTRGPF